MDKESLNTKSPTLKNRKAQNSSLVIFDLPTLIERLKLKHARKDGDLNSMILLKSPYKQIVLTTLHEGAEIQSF